MIRNITKADLPILAELVGDMSLLDRNDICYEYSMLEENEENITAAIILKQNTVSTYYCDLIPLDRNTKNIGEASWFCDALSKYDNGSQYEIVGLFASSEADYMHIYNLYMNILHNSNIKLVWTSTYGDNTISEFLKFEFWQYNDDIWVDDYISID